MYNTSVICTYNSGNVFLPTDDIDDDSKNFVRNVIYRQEMCNIFEMDEYDSNIVDKELSIIYEKIKDNHEFYSCIKSAASKFIFPDDDLMGMTILYAFDYMEVTHTCVSEFLNKNTISDDNLEKLKNLLEK